ncbi:uncharacterized protein BJ212DRAFT_1362790 [Suillus subaureus]|uniref:Uncharacterized protein n=1 Tax=Suillus subaureus TaxID=48587 RepID=A0A9P7E8B7_9AGAM|nr:uncharacterized protein BJ212DRAFT_1407894 [Suillus subaureus]XP_041191764.1 uncharacterized protein BJ212DRAFT_1362790 [Suillus subaureus]KAG1796530.1 hypothetical protein BJ212DRAFT_1407894 [Suillus subaureus]KAG1814303.1 hypothetical protein BJ212DRAFT_1362790 [Suillus subaureus]
MSLGLASQSASMRKHRRYATLLHSPRHTRNRISDGIGMPCPSLCALTNQHEHHAS